MLLDRTFFERTACKDHKGAVLEAYKAVYARSTMVLFSRKTRTPLAALTLKADDVGCLSMLTGRPALAGATEPYIQGMLNIPDQPFMFTISNLSDQGMINFNILHTPHRVSTVDPGPSYGINEVNELHANQSYTVSADQRNNCRMVLGGKTKLVRDPKSGEEQECAVTVKESEGEEKPTGLYFYLSVVADRACKELVDKFAEGTVWKVTPGFVRHVAKPPPPSPARYYSASSATSAAISPYPWTQATYADIVRAENMASRRADDVAAANHHSFFSSSHALRALYAGDPPGMSPRATISLQDMTSSRFLGAAGSGATSHGSFLARAGRSVRTLWARAGEGAREADHVLNTSSSAQGRSAAATDSREVQTAPGSGPARSRQPYQTSAPGRAMANMTTSPRPQGPDLRCNGFPPTQSSPAPPVVAGGSGSPHPPLPRPYDGDDDSPATRETSLTESVDVGLTQAAELKYGSQVHVQSSYTGHDYSYEHCSEPTVLCLSLWQDMKFLPLYDIEQELREEMDEWVKNEGKALIESLGAVYKQETCVIDLESEADTIICTCGHQCINHANVGMSNLDRCPLCRSHITAFVRADGMLAQ